MSATLMSREEVAALGKRLYELKIRPDVETDENIGKMVIIDVETGDYSVDETGIEAAQKLHALRPNARLYGTCRAVRGRRSGDGG